MTRPRKLLRLLLGAEQQSLQDGIATGKRTACPIKHANFCGTSMSVDPERDSNANISLGTQTPTLRWIFQCFMAVHYVVLNNEPQIVNLSDERQHILAFLGAPCRRDYLMC